MNAVKKERNKFYDSLWNPTFCWPQCTTVALLVLIVGTGWLVITSSSVQVTMEWNSRSAATESGHLRNFPMCMTKTEIKWSFVFSLSLVFLICVLLFCFLSAKCVSRSFTGNIEWKHHRLKWFRLMKCIVGALMKYCCSLLLPQGCVESSGVDHRRRRGSRTRASDAFCGKECCCRYLGR